MELTSGIFPFSIVARKVSPVECLVEKSILKDSDIAGFDWIWPESLSDFPCLH